jgi:hypothetical protein
MALPVVHINIWQARDEKLQLLLIEDLDQLGWDDVVEACDAAVLAKEEFDFTTSYGVGC